MCYFFAKWRKSRISNYFKSGTCSKLQICLSHAAAKELGIQQVGSFRCLNGKVDLSTHEAEHTLQEWRDKLRNMRQEMSVRTIAKKISTARVPYTVKVLAYKNSEGRRREAQLIIGSSVAGVRAFVEFLHYDRLHRKIFHVQLLILVKVVLMRI